jgi:hypothetical protein
MAPYGPMYAVSDNTGINQRANRSKLGAALVAKSKEGNSDGATRFFEMGVRD